MASATRWSRRVLPTLSDVLGSIGVGPSASFDARLKSLNDAVCLTLEESRIPPHRCHHARDNKVAPAVAAALSQHSSQCRVAQLEVMPQGYRDMESDNPVKDLADRLV